MFLLDNRCAYKVGEKRKKTLQDMNVKTLCASTELKSIRYLI